MVWRLGSGLRCEGLPGRPTNAGPAAPIRPATGACGPWRGGRRSRRGLHGSSCARGNRAYGRGGSWKADRCASWSFPGKGLPGDARRGHWITGGQVPAARTALQTPTLPGSRLACCTPLWSLATPDTACLVRFCWIGQLGPALRHQAFRPCALGKPTIRAKTPFAVKHLHRGAWRSRALQAPPGTVDNCLATGRQAYNAAAHRTTCPQ